MFGLLGALSYQVPGVRRILLHDCRTGGSELVHLSELILNLNLQLWCFIVFIEIEPAPQPRFRPQQPEPEPEPEPDNEIGLERYFVGSAGGGDVFCC